MKLFADLYLDEDVSVLVATLLRVRGFNVTTARDEGMLHGDDPEQLAYAVSLRRCIFTHNRVHYERLHRDHLAVGQKHFGIIIGSRRNAYELARRIAVILNTLAADEIENQLLYV
jgi:predicted nuclease of predicted toxin-antitoxin system